MLLVSCGRSPDPPFVSQSGNLGEFLLSAISDGGPRGDISNHSPTSWHSRVLTDRHRSGEYLDGRQALQVATSRTNFVFVESLLTQRLGSPHFPLRQEQGWREVAWLVPDHHLAVRLIDYDDENQCRIEVVTKRSKGRP
jgi:hypothetical protein